MRNLVFVSSRCTTHSSSRWVPLLFHVPLGKVEPPCSRIYPSSHFFFSLLLSATLLNSQNMATASTSGLSASVTRILHLTGFPKELKTKDIQVAFSEWESVGGGFKIKWIDDTSLLIVFQDASVGTSSYAARPLSKSPQPIIYSQACLSPRSRLPSCHFDNQFVCLHQTI